MKFLQKTLAVLFVVLSVGMIQPFTATAIGTSGRTTPSESILGPARCGECNHNLDVNSHWFDGDDCDSGSNCYDCVAFNSCHSNQQKPYQCGVFHWLCAASVAALDAVDDAPRRPEAEVLIRAVARARPEFVMVRSDGYVLVHGCNGTLVAAYRLDTQAPVPVVTSWFMADASQVFGRALYSNQAYQFSDVWRSV